MGLPINVFSHNIYILFFSLELQREKGHPQKEVNELIIKDNNVFKGLTFVINRFTYLFEFG